MRRTTIALGRNTYCWGLLSALLVGAMGAFIITWWINATGEGFLVDCATPPSHREAAAFPSLGTKGMAVTYYGFYLRLLNCTVPDHTIVWEDQYLTKGEAYERQLAHPNITRVGIYGGRTYTESRYYREVSSNRSGMYAVRGITILITVICVVVLGIHAFESVRTKLATRKILAEHIDFY